MRKKRRETHHLGIGASAQIEVLDVTCDGCGNAKIRVRSLNRLVVEAATKGWHCAKKGRDLCPDCRLKERPPALEKAVQTTLWR